MPDDVVEITDEEYATLLVAPVPATTDELIVTARSKRDWLIAATDYLVTPDYPITAEKLTEVKVYRQALRDITKQENFPADIKWPNPPLL